MSGNTALNNMNAMLANQEDPELFLLQNSAMTQNLELQIQGGVSQVLQAWSEGATNQISAGDAKLESDAAAMASVTGTSTSAQDQLQKDNTQYNMDQTIYSNLNNQYSNIMQGGGTIVTDLTQVQQQALQLCQVTVDYQNNANQLISGWAS